MKQLLQTVCLAFVFALFVVPAVEQSAVVAQRFGGSSMPQTSQPNFRQPRIPQPNFRPSVPPTNFRPMSPPRMTPTPTYQPKVNFQPPTSIPSSQPSNTSRYRVRSYRGLLKLGVFVVFGLIALAAWAARQIASS